jgi:hypothetical protein
MLNAKESAIDSGQCGILVTSRLLIRRSLRLYPLQVQCAPQGHPSGNEGAVFTAAGVDQHGGKATHSRQYGTLHTCELRAVV